MASNKKKPADQKPEDEVIDGQEQTATNETGGDPEGSDPAAPAGSDEPEAEAEAEDGSSLEESDEPTIAATPVVQPADLHGRLTKAVKALSPHAGQEKAFALHQLELLTGRLKMAIPAAIAATDDAELLAGLNALLGIL